MNNDRLDKVIDEIRTETADPQAAEQAAVRVRQRLFARGGDAAAIGQIRDCADFQALIPAYLAHSLSDARRLLLEDHTHSCVDCRHALQAAQSGKVRTLARPRTVSTQLSQRMRWAIAAAVIIGVGVSSYSLIRALVPAPGVRATVQSVNGILYQVSDRKSTPIFT